MEPAPKTYWSGTHRTIDPRETLDRVRPHLPAMGITRLANVTGLDTIGIPVVMAVRPNSRSLAVAQGKGIDLDAAKASAVMESVESYHAERIDLPLRLASYNEMRARYKIADPEQLELAVGGLYHSNLPLLWVEGADWLHDEPVWVPYELVHSAYMRDPRFEAVAFRATTNGLASGNHLLEAVSHALCEVVERDEWARWEELDPAAMESTRIALETVDDPCCLDLLHRFQAAGVDVGLWDLSASTQMPVFACIAASRDGDWLPSMPDGMGAGCHPTRQVALLRALTEAAQSRLTYIAGSRDDLRRADYAAPSPAGQGIREWIPAPVPGPRSFGATPSFDSATLEEDVEWELSRIRDRGLRQVIVVDLSMGARDWSVVRVIVPGMRMSREH